MVFQPENVNPADETSSEYSFYPDSLDIDAPSIRSLALVFPRCKDIFQNPQNGWNIILLASQTLIVLDLPCYIDLLSDYLLEDNPFDLGQLPALRHIKIQLEISCQHDKRSERMLYLVNQVLSVPSSTRSIETIEITITWDNNADGENLFGPDIGWSTLDETLTCDKLVCLRKVVLDLRVWKLIDYDDRLEFKKYLTIPFINALFPKFTANAQHTLEIHVKIFYINSTFL